MNKQTYQIWKDSRVSTKNMELTILMFFVFAELFRILTWQLPYWFCLLNGCLGILGVVLYFIIPTSIFNALQEKEFKRIMDNINKVNK